MTALIDSLRELAHQRSAISQEPSDLERIIRRAIEAVQMRPEFRSHRITLRAETELEGMFDPRKLEREFFNLGLNAFEATPDGDGQVNFEWQSGKDCFDMLVLN